MAKDNTIRYDTLGYDTIQYDMILQEWTADDGTKFEICGNSKSRCRINLFTF